MRTMGILAMGGGRRRYKCSCEAATFYVNYSTTQKKHDPGKANLTVHEIGLPINLLPVGLAFHASPYCTIRKDDALILSKKSATFHVN